MDVVPLYVFLKGGFWRQDLYFHVALRGKHVYRENSPQHIFKRCRANSSQHPSTQPEAANSAMSSPLAEGCCAVAPNYKAPPQRQDIIEEAKVMKIILSLFCILASNPSHTWLLLLLLLLSRFYRGGWIQWRWSPPWMGLLRKGPQNTMHPPPPEEHPQNLVSKSTKSLGYYAKFLSKVVLRAQGPLLSKTSLNHLHHHCLQVLLGWERAIFLLFMHEQWGLGRPHKARELYPFPSPNLTKHL